MPKHRIPRASFATLSAIAVIAAAPAESAVRTAAGFHKDKVCNYAGGIIPFARTRAERETKGDPRLSLEERYGTHDGYVRAVEIAAKRATQAGFLLERDARALVAQATASEVLKDATATAR